MSQAKTYASYRQFYKDKSVSTAILAAASGTVENVVAPRNTSHTIYIQRILFNVTTDAAQTLTFQDDANTPVVIGKSKSSPGLGLHVVADYGAAGVALTAGKNLDVVISAAGLAGVYTIEAYEKLTVAAAASA